MYTLLNGKPIDSTLLEATMEDSDLTTRYFLNLVTGEVVFLSDYIGILTRMNAWRKNEWLKSIF